MWSAIYRFLRLSCSSPIDGQLSSPPFSSRLRCAFCISTVLIIRRRGVSKRAHLGSKTRAKKHRAFRCLQLSVSLYSLSSIDDRRTSSSSFSWVWGKFEKQRGRRRGKKKSVFLLPDVLRVVSRRAPRRHHVTDLVRVAFESIALVFLFIFNPQSVSVK